LLRELEEPRARCADSPPRRSFPLELPTDELRSLVERNPLLISRDGASAIDLPRLVGSARWTRLLDSGRADSGARVSGARARVPRDSRDRSGALVDDLVGLAERVVGVSREGRI
jgi:hypothetical protein